MGEKKFYVRNVKMLKGGKINGKEFKVGEVVNPRHYKWGIEFMLFLEQEKIAELRRTLY